MYTLDPTMPVLLRPDGAVQVGWDPARAVLVRPPDGLSASALAAVLTALPLNADAAVRLARDSGLRDLEAFTAVLDGLAERGVLSRGRPLQGRALSIRVYGCGPLSELLLDGLHRSGARVSHSSQIHGGICGVDLVVLADALATDPRLLRELHNARLPHLPVRVRDGTGLVGPLVVPGVTSCLSCVDRHRTDRDAAWPALSAQLREVIGCADRPTLLATAALALGQLQRVIAGVREGAPPSPPPETFDTTWEVDVAAQTIRARRWPRHPLCGCWPGHG